MKNPSLYFENVEQYIALHPDHSPLAMLMAAVRSNGCPEDMIDAVINSAIARVINLAVTPPKNIMTISKDGVGYDTFKEYNPTIEELINDIINYTEEEETEPETENNIVVHHCKINLIIVDFNELVSDEFILVILLVSKIENQIKYNGQETSFAFGNKLSTIHSLSAGLSKSISRVSIKLEDLEFCENKEISFHLESNTASIDFSKAHSIYGLPDITCEGNDPAADNVIVETSNTTDTRNQLAWIHTHAIRSHKILSFNFCVILSFQSFNNQVNTIYRK